MRCCLIIWFGLGRQYYTYFYILSDFGSFNGHVLSTTLPNWIFYTYQLPTHLTIWIDPPSTKLPRFLKPGGTKLGATNPLCKKACKDFIFELLQKLLHGCRITFGNCNDALRAGGHVWMVWFDIIIRHDSVFNISITHDTFSKLET